MAVRVSMLGTRLLATWLSDLGAWKVAKVDISLNSTLEMTEMIRVYTHLVPEDNRFSQTGLLHGLGADFKRIVQSVVEEVFIEQQ